MGSPTSLSHLSRQTCWLYEHTPILSIRTSCDVSKFLPYIEGWIKPIWFLPIIVNYSIWNIELQELMFVVVLGADSFCQELIEVNAWLHVRVVVVSSLSEVHMPDPLLVRLSCPLLPVRSLLPRNKPEFMIVQMSLHLFLFAHRMKYLLPYLQVSWLSFIKLSVGLLFCLQSCMATWCRRPLERRQLAFLCASFLFK